MKTPRLAVLLSLVMFAASSPAQGPLTPPGAPAPTMRSLAEVEPRIPLKDGSPGVTANSNGGFTIDQPGAYYLKGNLTVAAGDGIAIGSDGVTVDLRGFAITSTANPAEGAGVRILDLQGGGARRAIAIENGHITGAITRSGDDYSGSGFLNGIVRGGSLPRAVRVTDISVAGVGGSGISLGFDAEDVTAIVVDRCSIELAGGTGINAATVSNSSVSLCRWGIIATAVTNCRVGSSINRGIGAKSVTNCSAIRNGTDGIEADVITGSTATGNGGIGLKGQDIFIVNEAVSGGTITGSSASGNGTGIQGRTITNCTAVANTNHGIHVSGLARSNTATRNGNGGAGAGIFFNNDGVRIEENNCYQNDWGIQGTAGTDSLIIRNSCKSNGEAPLNPAPPAPATGDYDFPTSNTYGPIVTDSGDMSENAATSHPWANFRY